MCRYSCINRCRGRGRYFPGSSFLCTHPHWHLSCALHSPRYHFSLFCQTNGMRPFTQNKLLKREWPQGWLASTSAITSEQKGKKAISWSIICFHSAPRCACLIPKRSSFLLGLMRSYRTAATLLSLSISFSVLLCFLSIFSNKCSDNSIYTEVQWLAMIDFPWDFCLSIKGSV
jgi:hypothetical protein